MASSASQLKPRGNKDDRGKYIKMLDEFFQLCNYKGCIKRILYEYFVEPDYFITSNRDADSCCSYYNNFLRLKIPERIIYGEKGVAFDIRKIHILNRLKIWAQDVAILKTIKGLFRFLAYYTVVVPHTILN